jgi:hypothetical protein
VRGYQNISCYTMRCSLLEVLVLRHVSMPLERTRPRAMELQRDLSWVHRQDGVIEKNVERNKSVSKGHAQAVSRH